VEEGERSNGIERIEPLVAPADHGILDRAHRQDESARNERLFVRPQQRKIADKGFLVTGHATDHLGAHRLDEWTRFGLACCAGK